MCVAVKFDVISSLWTVGVAKRREGLKKQHGVLFFPERDRTAVRPPVPTKVSTDFIGVAAKLIKAFLATFFSKKVTDKSKFNLMLIH